MNLDEAQETTSSCITYVHSVIPSPNGRVLSVHVYVMGFPTDVSHMVSEAMQQG